MALFPAPASPLRSPMTDTDMVMDTICDMSSQSGTSSITHTTPSPAVRAEGKDTTIMQCVCPDPCLSSTAKRS
eukprot:m.4386 g.4386  ORF g.4386 m.4386 type:complete len:73 (+) comp1338_c0_seq1:561-779(+)